MRGDFTSSTIVIRKGKEAWLATQRSVKGIPVAEAQRKAASFAPDTGVFKMALGLAHAIGHSDAWKGLATRAVVDHQGRQHYRLTPSGNARGHQMVSVLIDAQTFRVSQMVLTGSGSELMFVFERYRKVADGVVLPFGMETRSAGKRTKYIYVQTLDLEPSTDPALFEKPSRLPKK